MNYLIASHHEWNMQNFIKLKNNTISDHSLFFIDSSNELSLDHLSSINPRYIFEPSLIKPGSPASRIAIITNIKTTPAIIVPLIEYNGFFI